jgi:hypothetical protein
MEIDEKSKQPHPPLAPPWENLVHRFCRTIAPDWKILRRAIQLRRE